MVEINSGSFSMQIIFVALYHSQVASSPHLLGSKRMFSAMTSGLVFAYWQSSSWAFVERRSLLGSGPGSDPYRLFALLLPLFEFGPFPSCPHFSLTPCPSLLNHYSMCRICRLDEPNDRLFSCSPYISILSLSMFSSTHIALIVVAEHSAQELNTRSLLTVLD